MKRDIDCCRSDMWIYGITTVPSRESIFVETLKSLSAGGFASPRLFVDGAGSGYEKYGRVTYRNPTLGAYGNYMLGLWELLIREPTASYYAMFQDDIRMCRNVRQYIEASTKIERQPQRYYNLCTYPQNQARLPAEGHKGWYLSNQMGRGAQALVFSRNGAIAVLASTRTIRHVCEGRRANKNIDGIISGALKPASYEEVVHSPSLVTHLNEEKSAIGNRPQPAIGEFFPGEEFDAMTLLTMT